MELICKKAVASVDLAEVRVSIDELVAYESSLSYLLETLPPHQLEERFGATRDELEGICDDLRQTISALQTSMPEPISA